MKRNVTKDIGVNVTWPQPGEVHDSEFEGFLESAAFYAVESLVGRDGSRS